MKNSEKSSGVYPLCFVLEIVFQQLQSIIMIVQCLNSGIDREDVISTNSFCGMAYSTVLEMYALLIGFIISVCQFYTIPDNKKAILKANLISLPCMIDITLDTPQEEQLPSDVAQLIHDTERSAILSANLFFPCFRADIQIFRQ